MAETTEKGLQTPQKTVLVMAVVRVECLDSVMVVMSHLASLKKKAWNLGAHWEML